MVKYACEAARVSRDTAYKRKQDDPAFAAQWANHLEEAADIIDREIFRRGVEGVEKPVYHAGEVVGNVREYSDGLLMLLAKSRRPDVYRERVSVKDETAQRQHPANAGNDRLIAQAFALLGEISASVAGGAPAAAGADGPVPANDAGRGAHDRAGGSQGK